MSDDRIDDILRRLDALERAAPGPPPPPAPPSPGGPAPFDEKRVVDLIVRLVTDQVDQVLTRRLREIGSQGSDIDVPRVLDELTTRIDIIVQKRLLELHQTKS